MTFALAKLIDTAAWAAQISSALNTLTVLMIVAVVIGGIVMWLWLDWSGR